MVKYRLQEMNDLSNSGKRVVYPKVTINRTLSTDELIEKMKFYNFGHPAGTIKAVLTDISTMIQYMMDMGYNVKLDGLGTFSLAIGFEDEKTNEMLSDKDKMLYRKVGIKDVNFKADTSLLKALKKDVSLTREESGVNKLKATKFSLGERIQRALQVIEKDGYITLSDYAYVNHLSRSSASRDLREITAGENPPLAIRGNGSHKVWIANKKYNQ